MRWLARVGLTVLLTLFGVISAFAAAVAYADPFFEYSFSVGRLTIFSDNKIDAHAANLLAHNVESRLLHSPFNDHVGRYNIFIADRGLKKALYFLPAPGAGGVTYYPFSARNIFLSGAALESGRLISQDGVVIDGVRTLGYYVAHEISHLQLGKRIGLWRYVTLPRWISEGLPDYAALGPMVDDEALRNAVAAGETGLTHWDTFGFYADYRFLVAYFLKQEGWSLDRLVTSKLDEQSAMAKALIGIQKGR